MKNKLFILSKTVSYALRHAPWEYELELDEEGWVSVEKLLSVLRTQRKEWKSLSVFDVEEMILHSSKKRFELKLDKIRALYGHSTPNKLAKQSAEPPELLYHGTTPEIAISISKEGLKPMNRQYVHLSTDKKVALKVGYRKSPQPKILIIKAKDAYLNGIHFYIGNEYVWLADNIPTQFIACAPSEHHD